jgi:hypothetical protein
MMLSCCGISSVSLHLGPDLFYKLNTELLMDIETLTLLIILLPLSCIIPILFMIFDSTEEKNDDDDDDFRGGGDGQRTIEWALISVSA